MAGATIRAARATMAGTDAAMDAITVARRRMRAHTAGAVTTMKIAGGIAAGELTSNRRAHRPAVRG
ncbi:hypothetical protein ASE63_20990 [Bosea sp. Root381]|nr:hypothetical protein ASE63_20990 [Bosea sp. Root381]